MKTLAELQATCDQLGLQVDCQRRTSKRLLTTTLRNHFWNQEHPDKPLPPQIEPMLLADWSDLTAEEAAALEADQHRWIVQQKMDGVRALLQVEKDGVRITGRGISDVTYRQIDHQGNLPHLTHGFERICGTVLDGELVCPQAELDTGTTLTTSALQAAVAVLATSPINAAKIQHTEENKLRFHVFDVLADSGKDVTRLPLSERLGVLERLVQKIENPYIENVRSFAVNKRAVHDQAVASGGEGTVWKRADEPYQPGRRVKHWIKRKRNIEVEAFVTDFKLGNSSRGHRHLVGAVEFSVREPDGQSKPVAWVSGWSDLERDRMTWKDRDGAPTLNPTLYGREAIIVGQEMSGRSQRIRHARLKKWIA